MRKTTIYSSRRTLTGTMLLVVSLWLSCGQLVCAEPSNLAINKRKLPKSGLLAVSSVSGASSSITGEVFGGDALFDPELPPITGSVSRRDENTWSFNVSNTSSDRYSINVDLLQKDELGQMLKSSSYSYSLRPGQREQQTAQVMRNSSRVELYLRSYRNLTQEQKAKEERK